MTLQAINAQALRPAVNFKANEKAETSAATATADAPAKENKHTALKVLGGATALALLGFGIYKMAKGKGANDTKKAAKQFEQLYPELRNIQHKHEGNKIVQAFENMRKPEDAKTYAKIRQELTHMDWDAAPLKRSEVIEGMKKAAEKA